MNRTYARCQGCAEVVWGCVWGYPCRNIIADGQSLSLEIYIYRNRKMKWKEAVIYEFIKNRII